MRKYEFLLFDADGTLYDFDQSEEYAISETWKEFGIEDSAATISLFKECNREMWSQLEKGLIDLESVSVGRFRLFKERARKHEPEIKLEVEAEEIAQFYRKKLGDKSVMLPNGLEVLKELKRRGYKMCITTNGLNDVQQSRMHREETKGMYEDVFTPFVTGYSKPNPKYYLKVFEKLGITDRSKAIVIGDSLTSDIQGGIDAGIDTIWYNPRKCESTLKPAYVIHDLLDLLNILQ